MSPVIEAMCRIAGAARVLLDLMDQQRKSPGTESEFLVAFGHRRLAEAFAHYEAAIAITNAAAESHAPSTTTTTPRESP